MKILFGTKVEFTEIYNKKRSGPHLEQVVRDFGVHQGIIMGQRNLPQGYVEYEDVGSHFVSRKGSYVKAYLVAFDMLSNPVYVPVANVKILR
jgi:hypothetical protein